MRSTYVAVAAVLLLTAIASFAQSASPPPTGMALQLGNEHVRVWRLTKLPHKPSPMHYTPPCVLIFLDHTRMRWTFRDKPALKEEFQAGSVKWWPGGEHISENIGETAINMLIVVPVSAVPKQSEK